MGENLTEIIQKIREQGSRGLEKPQRLFFFNRGLKWCWQCEPPRPRPFSEFCCDRYSTDGLAKKCRECQSLKNKENRIRCDDCGGERSVFSAVRCRACYRVRAMGRQQFTRFRWPNGFEREALTLLRTWTIPWPEAEKRLTKLAESAASSVLEAAKEFDWFKHVSMDEPVGEFGQQRIERFEQHVYPSPDAFIENEMSDLSE